VCACVRACTQTSPFSQVALAVPLMHLNRLSCQKPSFLLLQLLSGRLCT